MRIARLLIFISLSLVMSTPAAANVRAPGANDGGFALPKVSEAALSAITLEHETLRIVAPRLVRGEAAPNARIVAEYTLDNGGEAVQLPLVFLGAHIKDPKVTVNGTALPAPPVQEMTDAQQLELEQIRDQKIGRPRHAHDRLPRYWGTVAPFEITLKPGRNTMRFEYDQQLWFAEGGTGYHAVRYDRATTRR